MSMKEETVEGIKAALLQDLAEPKQEQSELQANSRLTNGRLDLLEKRYDYLRGQMNQRFSDLKSDMNQRFEQVNQRVELVNQRVDEIHKRMTSLENEQESLRRDIAEVRSYVWTTGLEYMAGRKKAPTKVREKDAGYGKKKG